MKALAWDDQPSYLEVLQKYLVRFHIHLEIVQTENGFIDRFFAEDWDFVVTDLVQENSPVQGEGDRTGYRIARGVADSEKGKNMPIFLITQHYDRLSSRDVALPSSVVVKSKSTYPGWMAGEIQQELVRRGVFVDRKKVFLIYGHERGVPGLRDRIEDFLEKRGLQVVTLGDSPLKVEIAGGLIAKMNECGAFLALCTPDDEVGTIFQPRPNVFLEIGLALGLSRGLQRLLILQRWGPKPEDQAVVPSDLQGVLAYRFEGEIQQHHEKLAEFLEKMGLELTK